jgi:hypothetical protein
MVRIKRV